ncbi:uncharacterized, partial [Tachysurus ichikawai]
FDTTIRQKNAERPAFRSYGDTDGSEAGRPNAGHHGDSGSRAN